MKLLFIASGRLPHPTGSGVSVLEYGLLTCFRNLGYAITIVPTRLKYATQGEEAEHTNYLLEMGYEVISLGLQRRSRQTRRQMARQFFFPSERIYFPVRNQRALFVDFVRELAPDIVFAYSWAGLAVSSLLGKDGPIHIVGIVDLLDGYANLYRQTVKLERGRRRLKRWIAAVGLRKKGTVALKYLATADLIIEHAWHHAQELRSMGFSNVRYMPHPLPSVETGGNETPHQMGQDDIVNVLIAGSLKGVSSVLGFEFFLDKVLPHFDRLRRLKELPRYRFRIVGHGQLVDSLKDRLCARDDVDFIGFVPVIRDEFLASDILLVNIPIEHGFRTRIAEAFSYGLCVIAHEANCAGIREAIPDKNILSSNDPEELAALIISGIIDPDLRGRIGRAGLETFVDGMSVEVATKTLKLWIDELQEKRFVTTTNSH